MLARRSISIAVLATALTPCVHAKTGDAGPPAIRVRILDEEAPLPGSLKEGLADSFARELRATGCGLVPAEPGADAAATDWTLQVRIRHFREFTEYDTTVLDRATNFDPNVRNRLTARIELRGSAAVFAGDDVDARAGRRFAVANAERPPNLSFDESWAREEARREAVESVADDWRKIACKAAKRSRKSR